ncbi:hypothetical protein GALMADRAFT_233684 [Galerina marginata CBS 339.88]|uniref:Uncharacterized protein n=1 Tax=Galerina marginata (strain CBS 339.88) TaxID=685588 RepID=A0A067TPD9_GALM3|nr:hypothetical protein GALMADRAFT_233684 [Galerina marginata CBS 339.88]
MKSPKAREYCCCAIPMVNAGIYATLIEQTALGILVGTLSIGTPSIVGASTPSFAKWILGIIAYAAAGVQLFGFIGVSKEKPTLYRRYVTLHGLFSSAAFSVAAAWIITSASRHPTAQAKCLKDFFSAADSSATEGDTLCDIFPWVDVGIMGALWVILAAFHIYLFVVISSYGTSQRRDHVQYDQVYDPTQPLTAENIPLDEQNDPWDSRPSGDYNYNSVNGRQNSNYKHVRQRSSVSTSDVFNQAHQEAKDGFSTANYEYSAYPSDTRNVAYPSYAYTQEAVPTPTQKYYSDRNDSLIEQPVQTQPHPAEGSFRRKTPRLR